METDNRKCEHCGDWPHDDGTACPVQDHIVLDLAAFRAARRENEVG
jgi:hypothetical protein